MNERRITDRRTATVTVSLATMQKIVLAGNKMQLWHNDCQEHADWESALAALRKETSK